MAADRPGADTQIRFAQLSDGPTLNALFNQVFDTQRDIAAWRWKFLREGSTRSLEWTAVAESENTGIIGQYPMIWRRFSVQAHDCLAAQAVDTAIAPSCRGGLSLVKELRFSATERAAAAGAVIAFGFPKPELRNIGRYLLKYEELADVRPCSVRLNVLGALTRRLAWLPNRVRALAGRVVAAARCLALLHGLEGDEHLRLETVSQFDKRFDRLWNRCRRQHEVIGARDARFLAWRFRAMPGRSYDASVLRSQASDDIDAYVVIRDVTEGASRVWYLMDFLSIDNAALDLMIRCLLRSASRAGADHLVVWATPGPHEAVFARYALRPRPGSEAVPIVYNMLTDRLQPDIVAEPRAWFLSFADFDTL